MKKNENLAPTILSAGVRCEVKQVGDRGGAIPVILPEKVVDPPNLEN